MSVHYTVELACIAYELLLQLVRVAVMEQKVKDRRLGKSDCNATCCRTYTVNKNEATTIALLCTRLTHYNAFELNLIQILITYFKSNWLNKHVVQWLLNVNN